MLQRPNNECFERIPHLKANNIRSKLTTKRKTIIQTITIFDNIFSNRTPSFNLADDQPRDTDK